MLLDRSGLFLPKHLINLKIFNFIIINYVFSTKSLLDSEQLFSAAKKNIKKMDINQINL